MGPVHDPDVTDDRDACAAPLEQSCTFRDGTFFKNLTIIESDLSQVCIIDNSPIVYSIVPGARLEQGMGGFEQGLGGFEQGLGARRIATCR